MANCRTLHDFKSTAVSTTRKQNTRAVLILSNAAAVPVAVQQNHLQPPVEQQQPDQQLHMRACQILYCADAAQKACAPTSGSCATDPVHACSRTTLIASTCSNAARKSPSLPKRKYIYPSKGTRTSTRCNSRTRMRCTAVLKTLGGCNRAIYLL